MELITFPDTEDLVIGWLNTNLTPPVVSEIPNPRPATFVTVIRTGGPKRNLVTDEGQITVESWAATKAEAHDLARLARGWLNAMQGEVVSGTQCYLATELSGPGYLPDPLSSQPRYTQSFSVALRGT